MLVSIAASGVALGLGAHAVSQIIEPPLVATIRLHVLAFIGIVIFFYKQQQHSLVLSLFGSFTVSVIYSLTLTASIAIYRLYFHRLRSIPGDTLNTLTNFSWIPIDWHGKRTNRLQVLHSRYGPIVRIGPREVSIASIEALLILLRSEGKECSERPRLFAHIFAQSPMKLEDEIALRKGDKGRLQAIEEISNDLEKCLSPLQNLANAFNTKLRKQIDQNLEYIDIADHFHRFSIEAAMLLGVGTVTETFEEGRLSQLMEPIDEQIRVLNTLTSVPYCIEAVRLIPSSTESFDKYISGALVTEGASDGSSFAARMINGTKEKLSNAVVIAEVRSHILQSSAAVRCVVTFCLLELLCQRQWLDRLQKEIHQSSSTTASLYGLPFLDACLDETLRLWPPIPCTMQRVTPSTGLDVRKSIKLPGNVIFSLPSFLIHRDELHFSSPNNFNPTRWLKKETTASNHNIDALCPFDSDAINSISKSLVLMQCRTLLVELLSKYEVHPAEHLSVAAIRREYRDQYVIAKATCHVKIRSI